MRSGIDAKGREGRDVREGKLYVEGRDLRVYSLGGLAQRRVPVDEPKSVKSDIPNWYQPTHKHDGNSAAHVRKRIT
jgi:hypothetical protein